MNIAFIKLCKTVDVPAVNSVIGNVPKALQKYADVGIFSNNSQVTVLEFLEAAELAYLGWGNSVQKANKLYNKHLSEEIKSH